MVFGISCLLVSFLPWVLPKPLSLGESGFFAVLWGIGYLAICNFIILKKRRPGSKVIFAIPKVHIFAIGFLFAFLIELFGNWIWKMWYYPPFPIYTYLIAMPFIIAIYFYFLLKGYVAVRALLLPFKKKIKIRRKRDGVVLRAVGFVGIFELVVGLVQTLSMVHYKDIYFFNSFGVQKFNALNVIVICMSIFFILEYIEYREREDTFLQHLWHGDWVPLASVLIASVVTSLSMEAMNLPAQIWQYTNWPGPHISQLHNLPSAIFLVWPVQYILLVAFYRVFYKKETVGLWD